MVSRFKILIISAVLFGVAAFICYTKTTWINGVKLNDLLYVSMYVQISAFSYVLIRLIKNILIRFFLILNFTNFVTLIIIYMYCFFYGNEQFIYLTLSLSIGTITALLYILWIFKPSLLRSMSKLLHLS